MRNRTSQLLALLIAVCALVGWLVGAGRAQPPLLRDADPSAPIKIPGKPGYVHLNQYLERQPTHIATNMEPVIPHPREEAAARRKLEALAQKSGARPNVLVFLVDDCGWMDFGFNGGGIAVGNPTPNLDRYASEGLILTSCYAQPTCSPTRATILTGQLPIHHGILSPPMYGQPGGLEGAITIAKLLSDQGYTTQCIGKWHCGENVGSQPQNVGFDAFRGFLSVSDMYTEWRDPHFNPEIALSPERTAWIQKVPFNKHEVQSTKGGKIENIRVIDIDVAKNLDQDWAKHGEEFLRKQKDNSKPFFLYYNTRAAHFDNYPNEYYQGRSPARTVYSDAIVEIDDVFGRLMKTLEETGQAENTLVFFTSDNGPEAEVAPYGRTPFRGAKGSTWEGGMRVPTFVYWKGMIKPRKSDGLFDLADLFNTSLSLAGKPGPEAGKLVPKDRYIDGIDQTSFLLADNGQSNRKSILYFLKAKFSGVRVDEFKLMKVVQLPTTVNQRGNLGGLSGTINEAVEGLLFNLYTNPKEDDSVLIRHLPAAIGLAAEALRYQTVLKKFPSNIKSPLD